MKILTIIRSHGIVAKLIDLENPTKTVIKIDNDDSIINNIIISQPESIMNVETMYDDKTGQLFDIIYIQVGDDYGGSDDDDDDMVPNDDPDFLRSILRGR